MSPTIHRHFRESLIIGTPDTVMVDLTNDEIASLASECPPALHGFARKIIDASNARKPIVVTHAGIKNGGVRISVDAPRHVAICRPEARLERKRCRRD